MMNKTIVEKHFDQVAEDYDYYKKKSSFYYSNLKDLLSSIIPSNKTVLEVGCGTGDLLASLNPKRGYGYDISSQMIEIAKEKYKDNKNLKFFSGSLLTASEPLDAIFMSDVIEHLEYPAEVFSKVSKLMNADTLFINTMANPIWEPILMLWEKLGWKMPEGPHRRIGYKDIEVLSEKAGLKIIKHDYKLLMPINIPYLTKFVNKYLEKPFKIFAFIEYFVAIKA